LWKLFLIFVFTKLKIHNYLTSGKGEITQYKNITKWKCSFSLVIGNSSLFLIHIVLVRCLLYFFDLSLTRIPHFQACKDTQTDPDFCIVARVEAFIAGWGLDEALKRAEAYRNAGMITIFTTLSLPRYNQNNMVLPSWSFSLHFTSGKLNARLLYNEIKWVFW
jgi:hypothetical protein